MNPAEEVRTWVERIVVGLDLCPFARGPLEAGRVRIAESRGFDAPAILAELMHEISLLDAPDPEADTSLLVIPALIDDFDAFLDLSGMAEALLSQSDLDGTYQLAHFHPHYVFDGVPEDDPANHTNRAPFPVLHILRWTDVREAMETHPDVSHIPRRNQALLRGLGGDGLPSLDQAPSRDFRSQLAPFKCWDRHTAALFEAHNEALEDCILQNREEVIALAEFIETHQIRSYLEIGVWTGRLVSALHSIFDFDTVAVADQGYARTRGFDIKVPSDAEVFWGDSDSDQFRAWRETLGHIDLVLIDANHSYEAVRRDFEINRAYPHRFIALHDITGANRWTAGVGRFWSELDHGHKTEICRPHAELELNHSIMGIGMWSSVIP